MGSCILTNSGRLKTKFLIHSVGPSFNQLTTKTNYQLLQSAVINALEKASMEIDIQSISMPPLSLGVLSREKCAEIILENIVKWSCHNNIGALRYIRICNLDDTTHRVFLRTLQNMFFWIEIKISQFLKTLIDCNELYSVNYPI